jgi:uncharacterized protein YgfB (UPF0149 family)
MTFSLRNKPEQGCQAGFIAILSTSVDKNNSCRINNRSEMEKKRKKLPKYEALTSALHEANSQLSAAECHGLIAAALTTQNTALISKYFTEDTELLKHDGELAELISQLVESSAAGYRDEDFNFQLLLPDDETALQDRSRALAEWCGGYVMGMLESGIKDFDTLPGDAAEAIKDLVEISQLDTSVDNGGSENDLMHLEEYVRVGVQIIYAELTKIKEQRTLEQ